MYDIIREGFFGDKMIKFVKVKGDKNTWNVVREETGEFLFEIKLSILLAISKKFNMVSELVKDMNTNLRGFGRWYEKLLIKYSKTFNAQNILDEAENFVYYATKYVDSKNIDFSEFFDKNKTTATSIQFDEVDIRQIAIASTSLKLYSVFFSSIYNDIPYNVETGEEDENFRGIIQLPENMHYKVFNVLIRGCVENNIHNKIFELIRSKTYRFYMSDKTMWKIIESMYSESCDSYVLSLFNFLMAKLIPILEINKNPIFFIVGYINDSVRWMLKDVYREQIFFGDSFSSNGEDIKGGKNQNSFSILCNNDLIDKTSRTAEKILINDYSLSEKSMDNLYSRLENIGSIYSYMKLLTLPVYKEIMDVSYGHLLTIPPKHCIFIGIFLYHLSKDVIGEEYPIISEFFLGVPNKYGQRIRFDTDSSYTMKYPEFIINSKYLFNSNSLFGFNEITMRMKILSRYCGILNHCKNKLENVIDGSEIAKVDAEEFEKQICGFFMKMYSGGLDKEFSIIRQKTDLFL